MNQKQCKRQRRAIKKLNEERARLEYLNRRPPVWRVLAYIKWLKEGERIWK